MGDDPEHSSAIKLGPRRPSVAVSAGTCLDPTGKGEFDALEFVSAFARLIQFKGLVKGHAHQRSPECRANGKPQHIDGDTNHEDFSADVEFFEHFDGGLCVC